jgi:hypothetical protein
LASKQFTPDGPIPGENFTSDTRNYPWHRPPEISDLDQGVEASIKLLTTKEQSFALLTMLQAGMPVVTAADLFVTSGIQQGKWTPDLALLLGGPVAHMMKLMADGYGIKYDMGLDDEHISMLPFLEASGEIDPRRAVTVADSIAAQEDSIKQQAAGQEQPSGMMGAPTPPPHTGGGFMGAPPPTEEVA